MEKKQKDQLVGNPQLFYRDAGIERESLNVEKRRIPLSFSSEIALQRFMGIEILSHRPEHMVMGRANSLLFSHNKERIVGPLENIRVDNARGLADAGFDDTDEGELALKRVMSGSLKGTSVGYFVERFKKLKEGEEFQIMNRTVVGTGRDNPTYVAVKWGPVEVSLVAAAADHTVGVGREATRSLDGIEIEEPIIKDENLSPDLDENRQIDKKGGIEEMDEKELQAKIDEALKGRDTTFQERMKKVFNRAATVGMEGLAFRMVSEGKTDEEITDAILLEMKKQRGVPTDGGEAQRVQVALDKITDDALARALTNPVIIEL